MSEQKTFDAAAALDPSRALVPAVVRVNSFVVKRGFWPKIRKLARRLPFAEDAVALWFCARDPATPTTTKGMLLAALAYFVVPSDVLPDWFAGLGFTDDAAVIGAAMALAGRAIQVAHREAARSLLDRLAGEP
jgi:uncharacterized membrane protein YkvA (DUF1232 family)